jgi:hypothetical protein
MLDVCFCDDRTISLLEHVGVARLTSHCDMPSYPARPSQATWQLRAAPAAKKSDADPTTRHVVWQNDTRSRSADHLSAEVNYNGGAPSRRLYDACRRTGKLQENRLRRAGTCATGVCASILLVRCVVMNQQITQSSPLEDELWKYSTGSGIMTRQVGDGSGTRCAVKRAPLPEEFCPRGNVFAMRRSCSP